MPECMIMSSRLTGSEKERKEGGVGRDREMAGGRGKMKRERKEEGGEKGPISLGGISIL